MKNPYTILEANIRENVVVIRTSSWDAIRFYETIIFRKSDGTQISYGDILVLNSQMSPDEICQTILDIGRRYSPTVESVKLESECQ